MTRIAIHPTTLDLREFKPGLGLQARGYVVVTGAEDLLQLGRFTFFGPLAAKILGVGPTGRSKVVRMNLVLATRIWPDIVLRALNNVKAVIEEKQAVNEGADIMKGTPPNFAPVVSDVRDDPKIGAHIGRGNHNPRLPPVTLTGLAPSIRLPPQAQLMANGFNELYKQGLRELPTTVAIGYVEKMKIATRQEPSRLYRYYFWCLVRSGTLKTNEAFKGDVVLKNLARQYRFEYLLPEWVQQNELNQEV